MSVPIEIQGVTQTKHNKIVRLIIQFLVGVLAFIFIGVIITHEPKHDGLWYFLDLLFFSAGVTFADSIADFIEDSTKSEYSHQSSYRSHITPQRKRQLKVESAYYYAMEQYPMIKEMTAFYWSILEIIDKELDTNTKSLDRLKFCKDHRFYMEKDENENNEYLIEHIEKMIIDYEKFLIEQGTEEVILENKRKLKEAVEQLQPGDVPAQEMFLDYYVPKTLEQLRTDSNLNIDDYIIKEKNDKTYSERLRDPRWCLFRRC